MMKFQIALNCYLSAFYLPVHLWFFFLQLILFAKEKRQRPNFPGAPLQLYTTNGSYDPGNGRIGERGVTERLSLFWGMLGFMSNLKYGKDNIILGWVISMQVIWRKIWWLKFGDLQLHDTDVVLPEAVRYQDELARASRVVSFHQNAISDLIENFSGMASSFPSKLTSVVALKLNSVPVFVRVTGFGKIEVVEKIDSSAAIIDPVSVLEGQQASAIVQKVRETVMDSINSQKASFSNII
ncbi:hypothetical protein C5167_035313 [Papaver somniferum]|uniref:EMC1 first beta-propeller domain-containing protein n=1 Tax=Papaver somniferum TaxID=3469 RepID=A0A4Y7KFL0_PAPSO|nr:hypothetical protein C5167_035313 [Papaver somniferum]